MKRAIWIILLAMILSGCKASATNIAQTEESKDHASFVLDKENATVMMDNLVFEIQNVIRVEYTYDPFGNLSESRTSQGMRNEYDYESDHLVHQKTYESACLKYDIYYTYDDMNRLLERKTVTANGLTLVTEYIYNYRKEKAINYNSDGSISFVSLAELDEHGKRIKINELANNGDVLRVSELEYEGDKLIRSTTNKEDQVIKTFLYEYNTYGDKVLDYIVYYDEPCMLTAKIYDYVYTDKGKPKEMTVYSVQSKIDEEKVRR